MGLKVVGAGVGRTGTLSLKRALEALGLGPCMHMLEMRRDPELLARWEAVARGVTPDWDRIFAGYRATVDWPAARYWRELAAHYPDAKVILTIRPAESWIRSVHRTIYTVMRDRAEIDHPLLRRRAEMAHALIAVETFGGRMDDPAHAIAVYRAHNDAVRRTIPAERLLVYDVAEGWAPLCAFLGRPRPDLPFPRDNSTAEFREMIAADRSRR